jgi:dTDP-4-amino-4,6-dideoxygalactose transaminase
MEPSKITRRTVLASAALPAVRSAENARPAVLGGEPVRKTPFSSWPVWDQTDEAGLTGVLKSGLWGRTAGGKRVEEFEAKYATLTGTKYCLATANGTSALICALNALDIGPGDEVLLPPYTFVATLNVILLQHALPVFVDSDIETSQIDASKIESRITPNTRVIVPVHLAGSPADLDAILDIAKRRSLPVIEDACQAHLGEWRGRKLGSLGDCGCFSFQASKNLNCGEGGALISNNEALFDRAYAFHGQGRARRGSNMTLSGYAMNGANLRLTEFQAALLMSQAKRIEGFAKRRDENAAYLTSLLAKIPGIAAQKLYPGTTRSAWHLFMMRYDPDVFGGLSRAAFLKALAAEGIPAASGYTPLNKEPFLEKVINSRHYKRIYGEAALKRWHEQNQCPQNDKLCAQSVWFMQNQLIGPRSDMDQIASAILKIRNSANEISRLA